MTETSHTDFEIAIERELHGALASREAEELGAHLVGCGECRAYQRAAMEMEANMEAVGTLYSKEVEWGKLRGRVIDQQQNLRFGTWLMGGVFGGMALLMALFGKPDRFSTIGLMASVATIGLLWLAWYRHALARDAQRETLSGLYDALLVDNRRQRRMQLALIALQSGLIAFVFIGHLMLDSHYDWLLVALFSLNITVAVRRLVVLRRERARLTDK